MDKETREELNDMSKRAFGSTSKWQTKIKKGKFITTKDYTKAGAQITVKKWVPVELDEVIAEMESILNKPESTTTEGS